MISYSIVLRTLGFGGEKYQALLDSIKAQSIQPAEFLVVIPHGYDLPKERLGLETFIRCDKGMVNQRVVGMNEAKGDYLLVVDDDVSFPEDFVEKLYNIMNRNEADIISPRLQEYFDIPTPSILKKTITFLSTGARISKARSRYAIRISRLGGSIHNANLSNNEIYLTQTGSGGCFFAKQKAIKQVNFENELWLEKNIAYAFPEDQVFFFKAFCIGIKTLYAHQLAYLHLDASAAVNDSKINVDKKTVKKHDSCRNMFIFWHRFQYSRIENVLWQKIVSLACIAWKVSFNLMLHMLFYGLRPSLWKCIAATWNGYIDGYKFIKSDEYKKLPKLPLL